MTFSRFFLLSALVIAAGCAEESRAPEATNTTAAEPAVSAQSQAESWREQRLVLGRETYAQACASCHEESGGDAPATGDREAWSGRSTLWSVVLQEHAAAGYLDMPARGGQENLTDEAVEAAVEYMMGITFPELPMD